MAHQVSTSPGSTLYYPYIHPRQINLLKAALLYWSRVRRIVPDMVRHGDYAHGDDQDAKFLTDRGLLVATAPEPYIEGAFETFLGYLEGRHEALQLNPDEARLLVERHHGIHVEKLGYNVLHRMEALGLAQRSGDWVAMRDELGALYMFCLASEAGRRIGAPLFAEPDGSSDIGQSLLFEPSNDTDVTSEHLARIGVRMPGPDDVAHVPTAKIVTFVERRASERDSFRDCVEQVIEAARSAKDVNAIEDYLATNRTRIRASVEDLRKTLDEIGVQGFGAAAKITVPTGLVAALTALPFSTMAAGILGATGIAVAGVTCFAETRGKLRAARRSSPYHYMLTLEREFGFRVIK
jgi:hypothetical protein